MTEIKKIMLDGKKVALRSSAATAILYRTKFKEDLLSVFSELSKETTDDGVLPEGATEVLMKATYIMALQADKNEKREFEEWLDQFNLLGLVSDLGAVTEILFSDQETIDEAKKNTDQPSAD